MTVQFWRRSAALATAAAVGIVSIADSALAERVEREFRNADGRERTYIAHLPDDPGRKDSWPVIMAFHGGFGTGENMEETTRMHAVDGAEEFVIVYPDGIVRSWNVTDDCCGRANRRGVDDLGLAADILEDLSRDLPVRDRIFATGYSNGAMLVYSMICERPGRIAAAVPFGAAMQQEPGACPAREPVPVMHLHGLEDPLSLFEGGLGDYERVGPQPPVSRGVEHLASTFSCAESGEVSRLGSVTCRRWSGCDEGAEVLLCPIPGLGHYWPGQQTTLFGETFLPMGPNRPELPGSQTVVNFFLEHLQDR
mgnify:CR=1 FL=1